MNDRETRKHGHSTNPAEISSNEAFDGNKRGTEMLDRAVKLSGKLRKVVEQLAKFSNVDERGAYGKTALHIAARDSNGDVVRMLIDAGWSPGVRDNFGLTPLHEAKNERVLQLLLKGGGVRSIEAADSDGLRPLHLAAIEGNVEMIHVLINAGAKINPVTIDGETAVHLAAMNGNLNVVETLENAGAILGMRRKDGKTPKDLAWDYNHEDVADFLEDHPDEGRIHWVRTLL